MNQNAANQLNPEQSLNQPIDQPVTGTKKKTREGLVLKPEHFQKSNGLKSLYNSIQKLSLDQNFKQDNVQLSMKKIMIILKSWNFQMIPRYSFDYFLQRCRKLGEHKFTQAYMTKVRRIHKGQQNWQNTSLQQQQNNELNNINLDHLNPNLINHNNQNNKIESLQQKIQRAIKLVNEIDKPSYNNNMKNKIQPNYQYNNQMEIENESCELQHNFMNNLEQQSENNDDCEELFRQMDALHKQKKQILSQQSHKSNSILNVNNNEQSKNEANNINNKNNKKLQTLKQEQQEMPYVPEGYQSMSYEEQSQNY